MQSFSILPADDYRHELRPGEQEVFYFQLTSLDGMVFGFLRTVFDHETVSEIVTLSVAGYLCEYKHQSRLTPEISRPADASGPSLQLMCVKPWRLWRCLFSAQVPEVGSTMAVQVDLALAFGAQNAPTHFRMDGYNRVQQDGKLRGKVCIGGKRWEGDLVGYRDHSWGYKPPGNGFDP